MTLPETVKLLAVINEVYPKFMDGRQIETTATIWQKIFANDPYVEVEAAFFAFVSTDEKGFAPAPGALRAILNKLHKPEGETTETEAWAMVQKALRNSIYNYDKEFAALPEEIQYCVGNAGMLKEWAMMDTETVNSVVASNFMRSYKVRSGHVREMQSLPPAVREVFGLLGDAMRMTDKRIEAPKQTLSLPEAEKPEHDKPEPKYREPSEGWKLAKARVEQLRAQRAQEQREKNERMAAELGL